MPTDLPRRAPVVIFVGTSDAQDRLCRSSQTDHPLDARPRQMTASEGNSSCLFSRPRKTSRQDRWV